MYTGVLSAFFVNFTVKLLEIVTLLKLKMPLAVLVMVTTLLLTLQVVLVGIEFVGLKLPSPPVLPLLKLHTACTLWAMSKNAMSFAHWAIIFVLFILAS